MDSSNGKWEGNAQFGGSWSRLLQEGGELTIENRIVGNEISLGHHNQGGENRTYFW